MSFTSKGTHEVLLAGAQDTMFKIDVEKGTITQTVRHASHLAITSLIEFLRFQPKKVTI